MRTIIVATALATLIATPVFAQKLPNDGGPMWSSTAAPPPPPPPGPRYTYRAWRYQDPYAAYALDPYAAYAAAPGAVVVDVMPRMPGMYNHGDYVGWDPDPNIRFQLWRDPKGAGSQ